MLKPVEVNGKLLSFERPRVMAIINLTPDSFYDGGRIAGEEALLADAEQKLAAGATILDLGAVSTRPGAREVSEAEELERLLPSLHALRKKFPDTFISIDTYRSRVAEACIHAGADIINDISGGQMDPQMLEVVGRYNVPYVLMHMQGTPQTMQENPQYWDVVKDVDAFFSTQLKKLREHGAGNIILDPGFGFGKTAVHNYQLLKHLSIFCTHGYPVLAGVSRKSMINRVLHTTPDTALNGTTVVNTLALLNGASILRVHDVAEARQAIELIDFYKHA